MVYHSHRHRAGTSSSFDDLSEVVTDVLEELTPHADKFDTVIATGLSGVTVAVPVALTLGKGLAILRKEQEDSHGFNGELVGVDAVTEKRVCWIDDFIGIGGTRARIMDAVSKYRGTLAVQMLYKHGEVELLT